MAGDTPEEIARFGTFLEEAARYFEGRPTNGEDAAHWSNVTNAETCRRIAAVLTAERARADKLQKSFNLRWQATQRAIKRWQEAHPGNDLTWPDSADLTVWLMEQLTALTAERAETDRQAKLRMDMEAAWHEERAAREKAEAELAKLMDPAALHLNALRLLSPAQKLHLGGQAMQEAVAKAKAERDTARADALREVRSFGTMSAERAADELLALIDKEPGHE